MSAPLYITCDPLARDFPSGWKDVWFRRHATRNQDKLPEYECPGCRRHFSHFEIDDLQGDHIWPYSLFGQSTWENYWLLCRWCNARKSNYVAREFRQALGTGEFRKRIVEFLSVHISQQRRERDPILGALLNPRED